MLVANAKSEHRKRVFGERFRDSVHIRGISNFMLVANAKIGASQAHEFKIILVEGMLISPYLRHT